MKPRTAATAQLAPPARVAWWRPCCRRLQRLSALSAETVLGQARRCKLVVCVEFFLHDTFVGNMRTWCIGILRSREAMLSALREVLAASAFLPAAQRGYAREFVYGWAAGSIPPHHPSRGWEQGDPLTPVLFTLAFAPPLRNLKADRFPPRMQWFPGCMPSNGPGSAWPGLVY